jgi:hypothetical protein
LVIVRGILDSIQKFKDTQNTCCDPSRPKRPREQQSRKKGQSNEGEKHGLPQGMLVKTSENHHEKKTQQWKDDEPRKPVAPSAIKR